MSSDKKNAPAIDDLISTEEDTFGSSISLSICENSIRIREKPKPINESIPRREEETDKEKWWLKRPNTRLGVLNTKKLDAKDKPSPSPSPDVSSSMAEFLEKEKFCKALYKSEGETKDKDDTLCDILASAAFDKYPSDFENATDEDIGSILEEMSKIAGALSPNSAPERTKSGNSSKNPTEEERSVEELLEEAEKLVKRNSSSISKNTAKSEALLLEKDQGDSENLGRVRQMEADIFQMIEDEVHKETEKIKKSPKYEMKRDTSPNFEVAFESLNGDPKPSKTLDFQRKMFEDQKVEVSSSSDLDDPIERHSKSEEANSAKKEEDKDNLQKEITDVDKDFFDNLLKKSKEKIEGGMSGSSSFGQEDFSHFLKLLQGQSDKEEQDKKKPVSTNNFLSQSLTGLNSADKKTDEAPSNPKSPAFPEKEISEILEKELLQIQGRKVTHEIVESDSSASGGRSGRSERGIRREGTFSRNSSIDRSSNVEFRKIESNSGKDASRDSGKSHDSKKDAKVVNSKNELYTVGLTPRLELFADAIPKLIAEKSCESLKKQEAEEMENEKEGIDEKEKSDEAADRCNTKPVVDEAAQGMNRDNILNTNRSEIKEAGKESNEDVQAEKIDLDMPDNKNQKKEIKFAKSKSYDQISKSISPHDIPDTKPIDYSKKVPIMKSPILKPKVQAKPVSKFSSKVKISSKPKKDSPKTATAPSLHFGVKGIQSKSTENMTKNYLAGGDTRKNLTKSNWESLCREEKHKNFLLKEQMNSEAKLYKTQIEGMRTSFEEELFALKKQNIILKAKVDELSLNDKKPEIHSKKDTKVLLLERELEKQESLIQAYETENKKLMNETKRLQEELKSLHHKQQIVTVDPNESQRLIDKIKDLEEQTLKLNLEVSELKEKNVDYAMKNEDFNQQNGLLKDELEMFKEQLKTKNNYISDQLQAMTTNELELRKQVEDLKIELSSKSEHLRMTKLDYDKLQQNILPLEKELLELRVKEGSWQEKLQVAKSHVEREKQLSQKLKDQVILDNRKIMDLNRQVREMERILKRKNPDSVSALILTANSDHDRIHSEKVKLLEERIACLESEMKTKEEAAHEKIVDFQKKFSEMKERYSTQVMELEGKLLAATVKNQKVCNDMFTQTMSKHVESKGVETKREEKERVQHVEKEERRETKPTKVGPKSQNLKEDTHLIATIRGLKLELTGKDKTVSKLTKELQELQKTNRKLQKEREKLLNEKRSSRNIDLDKAGSRSVLSDSRPASSKASETNDQNSNIYQNGNALPGNQRLSASAQRLYDPLQFSETGENAIMKRLMDENEILKEELSKMNKDFMALKNKRLHDLNLLQEEHEREMAGLVKEYSVKFGDSKVVKLQGQINTQLAIISHLKQQIEKLRDYKEQVVVLKVEREHLENKIKTLNEKVRYLATPGTEQLQLLQDKITTLQQRHESREMTLQSLVRDLLRNKTQCRDCRGEKGKNKQLCYFRQELDHILAMLQEIANIQ